MDSKKTSCYRAHRWKRQSCYRANLKKRAVTELTAGSDSLATEQTEVPQLAELVNQEAGLSSEIELKVIRNEIVEYSYQWNGNQVSSQKVQIILQSKIPDQYCLGVAKLQKKDKNELKKMADRWQTGTTWRFKAITLLNDKAAYIHTPCRIRARASQRRRCQPSPSQTYCN